MEENSNFCITLVLKRHFMIKFSWFLIHFQNKSFINPIEWAKDTWSDQIHDWHAGWEHQKTPKVCKLLWIYIVYRNFRPSIQNIKIILDKFLSINIYFVFFNLASWFLKRSSFSSPIHILTNLLDVSHQYFWYMRCKYLNKHRKTQNGSNSIVPIRAEISEFSIKNGYKS